MAPDSAEASIKSKRPSDSAFKQQRLPAWQPILTAGTVLPTFFVIGIAFIPVGIGLLYFSDEVKEKVIDYTYCRNDNGDMCSEVINKNPNANCVCHINFQLDTDFQGKVYMYYGLSNFYQNHRRYVKSRDDNQLIGKLSNEVSSDCQPFAYEHDNKTGAEIPIAPCGAIANSLFSDVLTLIYKDKDNDVVPLLNRGIAWDSDKNIKFRNPDAPNGLKEAFRGFTKPKAWKKNIYELDTDETNNGFQNEDFIVWMRTAASSDFQKTVSRIDHSVSGYKDGLYRGNYMLTVDFSYDVKPLDGSKRMILSTTVTRRKILSRNCVHCSWLYLPLIRNYFVIYSHQMWKR
ncbi:hypothetical protein RN001_012748 [Aquatica leii]|uniref:P4-ATPase flippase complex beta subunit TMEM30A n=1 Tax=Aquatica leii TaxID=1421715 RepID=A0AAN7P6N4_9COLE|nr:hypothetical protein RN001_012748 [Aquatica leii]